MGSSEALSRMLHVEEFGKSSVAGTRLAGAKRTRAGLARSLTRCVPSPAPPRPIANPSHRPLCSLVIIHLPALWIGFDDLPPSYVSVSWVGLATVPLNFTVTTVRPVVRAAG